MPGSDVRPTPDRLREALFNILGPSIAGSVFVDAYAGTGAVGIEALSRGAGHVTFIEKNRAAAELIRANLAALDAEGRARVIQGSATLHLGEIEPDTVFIDPPYPKEREYGAAMDALESSPARVIIFQHSIRFETPERFGAFERYRLLRQGDNALSFFRPVTEPL